MCARSASSRRSAIVENELMPVVAPEIVLERLHGLPGGEALLEVAGQRSDVELVGGAVRDLLLGREPRELDVVVGGDEEAFTQAAPLFARELAARLGVLAGANGHERFGTALVEWDGGRIDVATRRAESYPASGALPDVRAGTEQEDLERRDFTVNAIAVRLGGERRGEVRAVADALSDLEAGRLRVLHKQSFVDDPTRLLRMARYRARLGFEVEDHTATVAAAAVAGRALDTVSGARIGAELRLALAEDDAVAALGAIDELGVLSALHPRLRLDKPIVLGALALLPEDGRRDLLLMAALGLPLILRAGEDPNVELSALLDRWDFPAADRDRVAAATVAVPRLIEQLPSAARPSALRAAVQGVPPEGVALAGALGCEEQARRWLQDMRHIHLEIDGSDLLAAGLPEGPEIGRRLEAVLELRLDGRLPDGREAELRAALGLPMPEENGAGGPV
jgi:tRNA nucleotidyltransferase (CCA-adding enzyme)